MFLSLHYRCFVRLSFHDRCVEISPICDVITHLFNFTGFTSENSLPRNTTNKSYRARSRIIILFSFCFNRLSKIEAIHFLPFEFPLISLSLPFLSLAIEFIADCATSTHDRRADADLKRNFENGTLSAAPALSKRSFATASPTPIRNTARDLSIFLILY